MKQLAAGKSVLWSTIFVASLASGVGLHLYSLPLQLSKDQKNAILWLHDEFRNNFEHFAPSRWSIPLKGVQNMCILILEIIQFLAIDCKNIHYHTNVKKNKIATTINQSIKLLKRSKFYVKKFQIQDHKKLGETFP